MACPFESLFMLSTKIVSDDLKNIRVRIEKILLAMVLWTMRTYGDGCATAQALDLVGDRWALLVVRELLLGPKRYTDLRRGLANASPNVLSDRLRELEEAGIVRRHKLPP